MKKDLKKNQLRIAMLAFHHCDKISDMNSLKEERFVLVHSLKVSVSGSLGPLLWVCGETETSCRRKLLTSQQSGSRKLENLWWASSFFCFCSIWASTLRRISFLTPWLYQSVFTRETFNARYTNIREFPREAYSGHP